MSLRMERSGMRLPCSGAYRGQSPDISKVKEITSSHTPRDDNNIFDNFLRLSLAKLIIEKYTLAPDE